MLDRLTVSSLMKSVIVLMAAAPKAIVPDLLLVALIFWIAIRRPISLRG